MSTLSLTLSLLVAGSTVSNQAISSSQDNSPSLSRQTRDTGGKKSKRRKSQRREVQVRDSSRRNRRRTKSNRGGSSGIRTQYSLEEQQATRDKVFNKKMQEIISHYSEDGMIWTSPDRELDSFEVANQSIDLQIETKFTDEEKQQVRDGLKKYWCGVQSLNSHGSPIYTRL